MKVKKITREDSRYIDWLLKDKTNGLEVAGLSEVVRILIEKINELISTQQENHQ